PPPEPRGTPNQTREPRPGYGRGSRDAVGRARGRRARSPWCGHGGRPGALAGSAVGLGGGHAARTAGAAVIGTSVAATTTDVIARGRGCIGRIGALGIGGLLALRVGGLLALGIGGLGRLGALGIVGGFGRGGLVGGLRVRIAVARLAGPSRRGGRLAGALLGRLGTE